MNVKRDGKTLVLSQCFFFFLFLYYEGRSKEKKIALPCGSTAREEEVQEMNVMRDGKHWCLAFI